MQKSDLKYWYLKNHRLFDMISDIELQQLGVISEFKVGDKNDVIYFSDSDRKRLYTLKEGVVKLSKMDANGKELITEILSDGDLFGCLDFSSTKSAGGSEQAIIISDHTKICSFEIDQLKKLISNNPNLSVNYTKEINDKKMRFQVKFEDMIFKDASQRIRDFFKDYTQRFGVESEKGLRAPMYLSHQEIADFTGTSRQTTTTEINKMIRENNLIYHTRKDIELIS